MLFLSLSTPFLEIDELNEVLGIDIYSVPIHVTNHAFLT